MRGFNLNAVALAAVMLLALGCVAPQPGAETVPPAGEEAAPPVGGAIMVDGDSNGQSVTLAPGDTLVVDLPADANGAESWQIAALDEGVLTQLSAADLAAATFLAAGEGMERLTFRAVAAGNATLTLVRAVELDPALTPVPDSLFTLDVTVTD